MLNYVLTVINNVVRSNEQQPNRSDEMTFEQLDVSTTKRHRTTRNNPNNRWNKIYNTVKTLAPQLPKANDNEPEYGFFVPFPKDVVEKSSSVYREVKKKNSTKLINTTTKVKNILKEVSEDLKVKRLNHPEKGVGLWVYRSK